MTTVYLTKGEKAVVDLLRARGGEVVPHTELVAVAGSRAAPHTNWAAVTVRSVRGKLGAECIRTVHGRGYAWNTSCELTVTPA